MQKKIVHPTSSEPNFNFKGFLVGNGATNWDVDISPSYPPVVYNFNLIPRTLLDTFENNDCHYYFNDVKSFNNSKLCEDTWNEINSLTTDVLNWYDLFRKVYPEDGFALKSNSANRLKTVNINGVDKTYKSGMTCNEYTPWVSYIPKSENHPLLGAYMSDYMNRLDVRRALHIPDSIPAWSNCNNDFQNYYHYQLEASEWIYRVLKPYGYKMLFYSGDTDGAVPTYGSRQWITGLGWDVKEEWRSWATDGQLSGYITRYDGLDFITVHGVGHLAPQWKRKDVTNMFTAWIHDEPIN